MITTRCPHCKKNSPAFRKDGYTKMFVKPLAGRSKAAQDQKQRLSEVESQTVASTKNASRKASTANEEESVVPSDEDEDLGEFEADDEMIDEEFKEGGQ